MPLYYIAILALVQGITEFLPVSSSGHLVLLHHFFAPEGASLDLSDNRILDVAVHVGTLVSVLVYFRSDIKQMIKGIFSVFTVDKLDDVTYSSGKTMAFNIIIASVPAIVFGLIIHMTEPNWLSSVKLVAWNLVIFGIILGIADRFFSDKRVITELNWKQAALIGLAQALALIPGVSRAGATITTARFLGFSRTESARFSLLLATVAISGAGVLSGIGLLENGNTALIYDALVCVSLAFIAGYIVIFFMMNWLARASLMPFVIYRICLGFILLILIYSGTIG